MSTILYFSPGIIPGVLSAGKFSPSFKGNFSVHCPPNMFSVSFVRFFTLGTLFLH